MKQIKIIDACFPQSKSMSARGENSDLAPSYFEWYRGNEYRDVCFFTDSTFHLAKETEAKIKVAWLIEPHPFRQSTYDYVQGNKHLFDHVLSYSQFYLRENEDWLFVPNCGSMIHPDRWGIKSKTKLCSLVVSKKDEATGHKLRLEIMERFSGQVDVFGYDKFTPKYDCLADYAYSIVVQGEKLNWFFDEKLIDCFAIGTVPIYWGCPSIGVLFDDWGVIDFDDLVTLEGIFVWLSEIDVKASIKQRNLEKAKQYLCTEDWLYREYPFLFEV